MHSGCTGCTGCLHWTKTFVWAEKQKWWIMKQGIQRANILQRLTSCWAQEFLPKRNFQQSLHKENDCGLNFWYFWALWVGSVTLSVSPVHLPIRWPSFLNVQTNRWSVTGVNSVELTNDVMFVKPVVCHLRDRRKVGFSVLQSHTTWRPWQC